MISLIVSDNENDWAPTHKALTDMGYPMSSRRISQVATNRDPEFGPESETWDQVIRKIGRAPGDLVYADWEFANHTAWRIPNTPSQLESKRLLVQAIRDAGKLGGLWNELSLSVHGDKPTSAMSLHNFKAGTAPDFTIRGATLRESLNTPDLVAKYVSNLMLYANTMKAFAPEVNHILSFQTFIRPAGNAILDMGATEIWVMARALRCSGLDVAWWFEDGTDLANTLAAAERHARDFMDGWTSIDN